MATSEPCEITMPETGREGLCTDTTCERSSGDTDNMDNTSDTLEHARLDRESQGSWECEYSYGGEADLHRHVDRCKKNPGHKNFIPVDKLSIEDLPESYRDKHVIDYIRAVSELTVRVTVKYVSDKRPANVPGSRKPYPGYGVRGQQRMTVGTGYVHSIRVDKDCITGPCKCKECRNSSTPEINFAKICVTTAAHVVFDNLDAEHTTCHLFFDRGGTPDSCSGVVTLTGMSGVYTNVTEDTCCMEHYTHDVELARRLKKTNNELNYQTRKVFFKLQQLCRFKQRLGAQDRHPLLFIVSHPHGCSKQVSIGHFTSAQVCISDIVSCMYSAATCPGSSGAKVVILQDHADRPVCIRPFKMQAVHRGVSDMNGENYCSTIKEFGNHNLVTLETVQLNKGPWADNFCCVEEGDENQHYAACQKNPGHGNFFPVDKFSLDNLPPFYRSDDLLEFTKIVSDLTVRVTVKYVSENRPETVPGTDIPYPWSSNRGSHMTRVGTGFIYTVRKKRSLLFIKIRTATHLVYDKLEAKHSTCQLLFNSGETPDICNNVIPAAGLIYFEKTNSIDICSISYATPNMDLEYRLDDILRRYRRGLRSLKEKYNIEEKGGDKATRDPCLHLVVSHPHGCAKQISIGYCGSPDGADAKDSQCSHTSTLCPGSSGAPVILPFLPKIYPVCEP